MADSVPAILQALPLEAIIEGHLQQPSKHKQWQLTPPLIL
jgi:hypothetical protein